MKEFTLKKYNLLSLSILSFIFCYPLSVYGLTKEQAAYYYGVGFGTAGIRCELVSYEKISIETALKARKMFFKSSPKLKNRGKMINGWNGVLKTLNDPQCNDLIW